MSDHTIDALMTDLVQCPTFYGYSERFTADGEAIECGVVLAINGELKLYGKSIPLSADRDAMACRSLLRSLAKQTVMAEMRRAANALDR